MSSDQPRAAAAGEAEGDAAVVGEGEAERPEHVDLLAGDEVRLDQRLGGLVEDDDEAAERAGQAPGAGARGRSPCDQADDDGRAG